MKQHRLPNGREVELSSFRISGTYAGVMEGDRQNASRHMLNDLKHRREGSFMVVPVGMPFPDWKCEADLGCRTGAHAGRDYRSSLSVTWFVANPSRTIDTLVKGVLPHLNWEQDAEDIEDAW